MRSTILHTMSRQVSRLALLALVVVPVSCGDDDPSEPSLVVSEDATVTVNAETVGAIDGVEFNFDGAGAVFDPALAGQDVSITFESSDATPQATIEFEGGGTITADVSFGSCIFVIATSSFPAGHRLAQGQTVTVNPCNIRLGTQGAPADSIARQRAAVFILGSAASTGSTVTVVVNPGGSITINGKAAGTVTLVPVSG